MGIEDASTYLATNNYVKPLDLRKRFPILRPQKLLFQCTTFFRFWYHWESVSRLGFNWTSDVFNL